MNDSHEASLHAGNTVCRKCITLQNIGKTVIMLVLVPYHAFQVNSAYVHTSQVYVTKQIGVVHFVHDELWGINNFVLETLPYIIFYPCSLLILN